MADIDSKLPVQDSADGTDGASAPSIAQQVGGVDGSGNLQSVSVDTAGRVNVNINGTVPVSGPLTDTQLRATAVPVSGTFFQATQPVSVASLPLPSGAATETTLSSINTKTLAAGQATMAASSPVVIASNQSSIPVTGTFFQTTQPISAASLPLPSGASTSALQTTGNTSLSSIDGKLSTKSGSLATNQISNGSGTQAALTVGTTAVLVNVSGTNLTNRVSATLYNNSALVMYWGYTSGVTTSTGTPIQPGQVVAWDVGASTNVYVITTLASQNARVTEAAS